MGNVVVAFTFVMILNVLMFLSQIALVTVSPDTNTLINFDQSLLDDYDIKNGTDKQLNTDKVSIDLPAGEGSISPVTQNYFTDIFSSIKNWIADTTGLKYLKAIALSPYNLLQAMNLPQNFSFAIGTLWYGISILLFILLLWGQD